METKNLTRLLVLSAVFTSLFSAVATAQSVNSAANGALSLVGLTISPQSVVAGENMTIEFQLYNSYSSALYNVNLQLSAENPIINVSPSSSSLIYAIGVGQYGGGAGYSNFVYTVHIPSTLHAGEYTIDVIANYQTSQPNSYGGTTTLPAESEVPINIYVYGTPSIKLSASPQSSISPGQAMSIPVSAVNVGTDIANNVTVNLHSTQYFKVFGTTDFSLGSINPDSSATFDASVQPSLDIVNGTYPINATITYLTQSGNYVKVNTSMELSTLINSPDIVASIVSANPTNLYSGGNQTLTIQVQNTGLGTAKNLSVRFLNGPGINVGSTSEFFISSLSPKNSTTETVYISANRTSNSNTSFSLPVSLKYDSSNYQGNFVVLQNIPINLQKSAVFQITNVTGNIQAGVAYKPVTFLIKNIGNEPADQITLSLQTTFPITPVNPNLYIDSLAPGQSTNATFYVGVDPSGNAGSYPVSIFEQWRQPNGAVSQVFSGSNGYYAQVGSSSSPISSYLTYAVVAVVVIVAAVFIMRRRMSATKKKPEK